MTWVVVGADRHEVAARALARDLGVTSAPIEDLGGAERAVLFGSDHDLASVGVDHPSTPILFVASGPSDLSRMFGFDRSRVRQRLSDGEPYPADLLLCESGGERHHVVGHAVASASGRLPRWWDRPTEIHIDRGQRSLTDRATAVVLANAQHVWGRTLAPRAAIMDGRAEFQILSGSWTGRAQALRRMRTGVHLRSDAVVRRSFDELALEVPRGWRFAVDRVPADGHAWTVRVLPGAMTLWV